MQVGGLEKPFASLKLSCPKEKLEIELRAQNLPTTPADSWSTLVSKAKDPRLLEADRDEINKRVNKTTEAIGQQLKLSPITWACCGTIGYKSDVDITIKTDNLQDAVRYKVLRDLVHRQLYGRSSSEHLDTQCYIPHSAEIDLAQDLYLPQSRDYFQTGEKAGVALQAHMSLGDSPTLLTQYIEQDLASIKDPIEKQAMQRLFEQAKVCRQADAAALQLRLAEQYTQLDQSTVQSRDDLTLQKQRRLLLISALQPEGTVSASEGRATIFKDGGQIHAQETKKRTQSLSLFDSGDELTISSLGRKFSLPITQQLAAGRDISKTIARQEYGPYVQQFLRPYFEKPDGQTCLIAAYEESWQLIHIIEKGLEAKLDAGEVAISGGKYADRVVKNLLRALQELGAPQGLVQWAQRLEQKCQSLECLKRARRISSHAATILLYDNAVETNGKRGSLDMTELKTKIEQMFSKFDRHSLQVLVDGPQHVELLKKALTDMKGYKIDPEHEDILPILQGHAGIELSEKLQKKAKSATLEHFHLTTAENVREFLQEILKLGQASRNWARKTGKMAISTEEMAAFYSFTDLL